MGSLSLLLLLSCLGLSAAAIQNPANGKVEWISVRTSDLLQMALEPAGFDSTGPLYVCGGSSQYGGKLLTSEGQLQCCGPRNAVEYCDTNFQVLSYPAGTVSWVPFPGNVTEDGVKVGDGVYGPLYICRGIYEDYIIPGNIFGGVCYLTLDGVQQGVSVENDIELLVINSYGKTLSVKQVT